jgi:hypothetical protein
MMMMMVMVTIKMIKMSNTWTLRTSVSQTKDSTAPHSNSSWSPGGIGGFGKDSGTLGQVGVVREKRKDSKESSKDSRESSRESSEDGREKRDSRAVEQERVVGPVREGGERRQVLVVWDEAE